MSDQNESDFLKLQSAQQLDTMAYQPSEHSSDQTWDQASDQAPYLDDEKLERNAYSGLEGDSSFSTADTVSSNNSGRKRLQNIRPPTRKPQQILKKPPKKETEYMGMLLHQSMVIEQTPLWNILAAGFTWVLLAGFIVLPGTYPSIQNSDLVQEAEEGEGNLGTQVVSSFANLGLLILASILCAIGVLGIVSLCFKWRKNYIWTINRILLPGLLNSVMGLISTLVNVLSKPPRTFNTTAIVTTVATGTLTVIFSCMFLYFNNYLLEAVKDDHRKAYGDEDVKAALANGNSGPVV